MTRKSNQEVVESIAKGGKLAVEKKSGLPYMWCSFGFIDVRIRRNVVEELGERIHKLTEKGEPPIEERKGSWRTGWREQGLNGYDYDWYVLTQ